MRKQIALLSTIAVSLVFMGQGCFEVAQDAGIFRSTDGARTFSSLAADVSPDLSLQEVNFFKTAIDPANGDNLLAGSESRGLFFSSDRGDSWQNVGVTSGSVRALALDPDDANLLYLSNNEKILRSDDGGSSFKQVYADQTGYIVDIYISPNRANTVYALTASGLFLVSTDQGETWNTNEIIDAVPTSMAVHKQNDQVIYVGTEKDGLLRSEDGGSSFASAEAIGYTELRRKASETQKISDVAVNPNDPDDIFVATSSGLVSTLDAGETWGVVPTLIAPNTVPLRTVAFHPTVENALFFSAGNKVYVSEDLGRSWAVVTLDTQREIYDITVHPEDKNEIFLSIKGEPERRQPTDLLIGSPERD